jgi:hypothetical protein
LSNLPGVGGRFERPIMPAMRVALSDVHAEYRIMRGGRAALVVTGTAHNLAPHALHAVQIAAGLLDDRQRVIAGRTAYCGINLSDRMIAEMTPRELDFLQRLEPHKSFRLEPDGAARFVLVFSDPPRNARSMRIAVTKAAAAEPESNPAAG